MTPRPGRLDLEYWQSRLFHAEYRRGVERRYVAGWSVKIQHRGIRKTLNLGTSDENQAARRARDFYRLLLDRGWTAVDRSLFVWGLAEDTPAAATGRQDPGATRPLIQTREYTRDLTPLGEHELAAVIDHQGQSAVFPLGTDQPNAAALKARRIRDTLTRSGWTQALLGYPREFIAAVTWLQNPFSCTYTTLHTIPAALDESGAASEDIQSASTLIVEPDGGVRRSLLSWFSRCLGNGAVAVAHSLRAAETWLEQFTPRWIFVGITQVDAPGTVALEGLLARSPRSHGFLHGVFQSSEHILGSVTGVTRGFLLLRRSPHDLLEPMKPLLSHPEWNEFQCELSLRRYFQNLYDPATGAGDSVKAILITRRERDILHLLSQGYSDKEIAGLLNISGWTVHNHLKHIYQKLGVRSRTEAVVKFLHH